MAADDEGDDNVESSDTDNCDEEAEAAEEVDTRLPSTPIRLWSDQDVSGRQAPARQKFREQADASESLRALHCQDSAPKHVIKDPPPELLRTVSFSEFQTQYRNFRAWTLSILKCPYANDFFIMFEKIDHEGNSIGQPFSASFGDIREASRWQPYLPKLGTTVSSKRSGKCRLVGATRSPDLAMLYSYVAKTNIKEVRCLGLWNIIACAARSDITQLRAKGLRGLVGEEAIMTMALTSLWAAGARTVAQGSASRVAPRADRGVWCCAKQCLHQTPSP